MKNILWASLLAASAAVTAGCHGGEAAATTGAPQTVHAQVVESRQQEIPVNLRSTGTVHSRETAVISAQVMGRIQQILVREGDSVRAGQALVTLDDAALRSQVVQAQSGVMHDMPAGEKWLGSPAQPDKQAKRQMIALQRLPDLLKRLNALEQKPGGKPE